MISFTVDARNGTDKDGCNTCCCETIPARPGETNKILINYAPWAAPIGGHGLAPRAGFEVDCISCATADTVIVQPGFARIVTGNTLNGTLAPLYTGDEPVTFEVLPLFDVSHGDLVVNADGTFIYTPNTLFAGIDRFYWSANGEVAEFIIAVDPSAEQQYPQPAFTAPVSVAKSRVQYDTKMYVMSFVLSVSPAAKTGDIYRLTIRQPAIDCDGNQFDHISCYDVVIGKC